MADRVKSLKEWTGKASATVLGGNNKDTFTRDGLFEKNKSKSNVALVVFTTDGDVFGGFYSVAVTEQWENSSDRDIFVFSFESHGRLETQQRFVVKEDMKSNTVRFLHERQLGMFGSRGLSWWVLAWR